MSFHDYVKKNVQSKRKPKNKTTLDKEKDLEKAKGAAGEYLDLVGQEDEEKAADAIMEIQGEVEKQEEETHHETVEEMEKNKQTKVRYTTKLAETLYKIMETVDFPPGYKWRIGIEGEDKLNLTFIDKNGRGYGQGIKITGLSVYDINAIHILATRCENTVDKLEGRIATEDEIKDSGIWVPGSPLRG